MSTNPTSISFSNKLSEYTFFLSLKKNCIYLRNFPYSTLQLSNRIQVLTKPTQELEETQKKNVMIIKIGIILILPE